MSGKWKKENVVLVDHESTDSDEYLSGLKDATNLDWGVISSVANQGRGTVMGSIARYAKYFWFPFIAFLHRNRFKNVIGWQAFYGINLAFFEKLFRVKKTHTLTIQHFIYKKKSGFLGFVYDRYIHYAVDSRYVDLIVTCSRGYANELNREFGMPEGAVRFAPFGVTDFQSKGILPSRGDYVLSLGRSNRDWSWLIGEASYSPMKFVIACDTLHCDDVPPNVEIRNDVNGVEALKLLAGCFCSVLPIENPSLSSGETVLLQSMCLGKPLLVTAPSGLATDYIDPGSNGYAIDKGASGELAQVLSDLNADNFKYETISRNTRTAYLDNYSLFAHGRYVGKEINFLVNRIEGSVQ